MYFLMETFTYFYYFFFSAINPNPKQQGPPDINTATSTSSSCFLLSVCYHNMASKAAQKRVSSLTTLLFQLGLTAVVNSSTRNMSPCRKSRRHTFGQYLMKRTS